MKELGQWAYELMAGEGTWADKSDFEQAFWRKLEAAIRADEREACAKVVEGEALETDDVEVRDWNIAIEHAVCAIRERKP